MGLDNAALRLSLKSNVPVANNNDGSVPVESVESGPEFASLISNRNTTLPFNCPVPAHEGGIVK